jgi:uncharacterized protein related to proFAR isomerase
VRLSPIQRMVAKREQEDLVDYLMKFDLIVLETDLVGFDKNCQAELLTKFTACRDR